MKSDEARPKRMSIRAQVIVGLVVGPMLGCVIGVALRPTDPSRELEERRVLAERAEASRREDEARTEAVVEPAFQWLVSLPLDVRKRSGYSKLLFAVQTAMDPPGTGHARHRWDARHSWVQNDARRALFEHHQARERAQRAGEVPEWLRESPEEKALSAALAAWKED
jgi:hypothetical protein